jgi:hypothetical protein
LTALSLMKAIQDGRLQDFITQEEARGVGPVVQADFDALAAKVIKTSQSAGQTSHSLPADGSRGK